MRVTLCTLLLLASAGVLPAVGLSPSDARSLRTFFREGGRSLVFEDPALERWYRSNVATVEGQAGFLAQTHELVRAGKLSREQGAIVLARMDVSRSVTSLPLTPEVRRWAEDWKLSLLQTKLAARRPLTADEQTILLDHTHPRRRALVVRELARAQEQLAPGVARYWAELQALGRAEKLRHLLLLETVGPQWRPAELFLAGFSPSAPSLLPADVIPVIRTRLTIERQWREAAIPEEASLSAYLDLWHQWQRNQTALRSHALSTKPPVRDILEAYAAQPLHVHRNHLVVAYLQEALIEKSGAPAVSRLLADYAITPRQFSLYLLNPTNLWLLGQVSPTSLVPFGGWLLQQAELPESRPGLETMLEHLYQVRAFDELAALGLKARNQLLSVWLDEWGQYATLLSHLGSGRYAEGRDQVALIERNGGCREFSPAKWQQAAIATLYLAGDFAAAYRLCWEQFALNPQAADRDFLAEMAMRVGDTYAGSLLRRLPSP